MKNQIHFKFKCSEDWEKMSKVDKGRHCLACDKRVVNLDLMEPNEIKKLFAKEKNVCGRLTGLNKVPRINTRLSFKFFVAFVFVFSGSMFVGFSQEKIQSLNKLKRTYLMDENTTSKRTEVQKKDSVFLDSLFIEGVVRDEFNEVLPYVNVVVKREDEILYGSFTDLDGNFCLDLDSVTLDSNCVIAFSFIGYESQQIKIDSLIDSPNLTLILEPIFYNQMLGVIVYKPKWYQVPGHLARRFYYRVTGLFR